MDNVRRMRLMIFAIGGSRILGRERAGQCIAARNMRLVARDACGAILFLRARKISHVQRLPMHNELHADTARSDADAAMQLRSHARRTTACVYQVAWKFLHKRGVRFFSYSFLFLFFKGLPRPFLPSSSFPLNTNDHCRVSLISFSPMVIPTLNDPTVFD